MFLVLSVCTTPLAQITIGADTTEVDSSAILDIRSDSQGLLVPRMSTEDRVSINDPATGLLVYDTVTASLWYYDTEQWQDISKQGLWTSSDSVIYYKPWNVGIGVENPTDKLHIMDSTGNSSLGFLPTSQGPQIRYRSHDEFDSIPLRIFFEDSTGMQTEVMHFSGDPDAAHVGIGTPSPASKLHVNDTVTAVAYSGDGSGLTGIAGDNLGDHVATAEIRLFDHKISNIAASNGLSINNNGTVTLEGDSTSESTLQLVGDNSPVIRFHQDGTGQFPEHIWDMAGNEVTFFVRDSYNSGRLPFKIRTDSDSNMLVVDGNYVGVGRTSPTTALDVDGKIRMRPGAAEGFVPVSDTTGLLTWADPLTIGDGLGNHIVTDTLQLNDHMIANGINTMGLTINNSGTASVKSGADQTGMILSNGDYASLQLVHTDELGAPMQTWGLTWGQQAGDTHLRLADITPLTTKFPFQITTGSPSNVLVVKNGYVGMGTTDPTTALDVAGSIKTRISTVDQIPVSDSTGTFTWTDVSELGEPDEMGNHTAQQTLDLNGNTLSGDGDTEGIYIRENGNVGIGAQPSAIEVLDVNSQSGGNFSVVEANPIADGTRLVAVANGDGFDAQISIENNSSKMRIGQNAEGDFSLSDSNNINLQIDKFTGNMSLGEITPSTKLDVDGQIRMRQGAGSGLVAVSDADGVMNWTDPGILPGDDLGDHLASESLKLNGHYISGDGQSEGIFIDDEGLVGIGTNSPQSEIEIDGTVLVDTVAFPDGSTMHSAKRVTMISAGAFQNSFGGHTVEVVTNGVNANGGTYAKSDTWGTWLHAPVQLPDGARVTKITFYGYDAHEVVDLELQVNRLSIQGTGYAPMAEYYTEGSSGSFIFETEDITAPKINNTAWRYRILVRPILNYWGTNGELAINGVKIEYTLD